MCVRSNISPACSFASRIGRIAFPALAVQTLLLAGCASPAFEGRAGASQEADKRRSDALACTPFDERLTGWLGESMLLGLTVGGGPAVIESENVAKRRAFKKCMDARQVQPAN